MKILIGLLMLFTATLCYSEPEKYYQRRWCEERGGQLEVVMPDGSRCDCLLDDYAVEFDFAKKWAESNGQRLRYSRHTNRTGGIVLIVNEVSDYRYIHNFIDDLNWMKTPYALWVVEDIK